ncbi:dimethylallyltransferase [Renibacterium salmoninarum ATCC 33209]|uniref:Dimethylallyltransferase n=1 Tax=Renibacterium salmoninarum (strain ATCC 33209 / DSM 20767 / JCM 11484 / NBRC 15589 / NCIMB 2235) TaxID=288705 RepID=A9WRF3_RENSM|nr:polyprenyl synthetase family protein [Renibacterium salmoninarum]ABY24235.1 dimethylallyltransferase [Renibacterium salmoninarum ATCC 33209]
MTTQPHSSVQDDYTQALGLELQEFLAVKRNELAEISVDAPALIDTISGLVTGGKRMRALLCYWGWRGAGGNPETSSPITTAGAALELFQAAALIHDDIIDRSDIRRGAPSVHRQFSQLHQRQRWALDPERFGHAAAILAGDLCLSFSEEVFSSINVPAPQKARSVFNTMRAEVMAGQYLDILEEVAGPSRGPENAVERAQSIIRYKSAKYSSEHPLVLGGALAGADANLLSGYSAFALPLGEAFQLRDDMLGVFGDPATTGKPAGDDLREGKRTVLIGYTLRLADSDQADFVDQRLGIPDLGEADIEQIRSIMVGCGAVAATEDLIGRYSDTAFEALDSLPIDENTMLALRSMAQAAVQRSA